MVTDYVFNILVAIIGFFVAIASNWTYDWLRRRGVLRENNGPWPVIVLAVVLLLLAAWLTMPLSRSSILPVAIALLYLLALILFVWFVVRDIQSGPRWGRWFGPCLAGMLLATMGYFLWVGTWIKPREPVCVDYGLKIAAPQAGDIIGLHPKVSGSYVIEPPADSVALFYAPKDLGYWPSAPPVQVLRESSTWESELYVGGPAFQEAEILIALLGKSGRTLIDYYREIGQETGQWPPIKELPDDVRVCDRIPVVLKPGP